MVEILINPLPKLPEFLLESPAVVKVLDKIRFDTQDEEPYQEFYWFVREYPRIYRYHLNHSNLRIQLIYNRYKAAYHYFSERLKNIEDECFELSFSDKHTHEIYWDFEAYLCAINSALDILARILSTAYQEQVPVSFNKLCNRSVLSGPVDILRNAKEQWVSKMKDYRDCFVHYTPVDNRPFIVCRRYSKSWDVRCKLPVNPNIRDIEGFKFSRRVELLKYTLTVHHHMKSLDKKIAKWISKAYSENIYPQRINNLFYVGSRNKNQ